MTIPSLRTRVSELVAKMPHNGATMFSTNKNELGHDKSCYKCKLTALLEAESEPLAATFEGLHLCPSCRATDNNGYIDDHGQKMRACGRCMIQWVENSSTAATRETEAGKRGDDVH